MSPFAAGCALALAVVTSLGVAPALAAPAPGDDYRAELTVARIVIDARVLDDRNDAVPGLGPGDFSVAVDGRPADLLQVEWSGSPAVPGGPGARGPALPPPAGAAPGRLIVLLFQRALHGLRTPGLLRMAARAREYVGSLEPTDYVAVLTFDTHLDLHLDFTRDHAGARDLLDERVVASVRPAPLAAGPEPSLVPGLDRAAALAAATPEAGLLVLAHALERLPGPKAVVFFAWGAGHLTSMGVFPNDEHEQAIEALVNARAAVFALDTTNADYHSLEGPLIAIAHDTGGSYEKTHEFVDQAMERLAAALAGQYVLVVRKPELRPGLHRLRVALARGVRGRVLARTFYVD
ncbi:MAG: hypothetical protein KBD01_01965 [Acidobacteria bacterium]|nr:hypothetical protein [Acidobacteriota bacterium]